MAIAENGEYRRSPDDVGTAKKILDLARKNPSTAISYGVMVSAFAGLGGYLIVDQVSGAAAERTARIEANEEARLAALKADFRETGGIDLVREQNSFRVTLRESARLAPQDAAEAVLIDNAWTRIKRETGCEPTQTITIPQVEDRQSSKILAPKMYLIGIKC